MSNSTMYTEPLHLHEYTHSLYYSNISGHTDGHTLGCAQSGCAQHQEIHNSMLQELLASATSGIRECL